MNRRNFIRNTTLLSGMVTLSPKLLWKKQTMKIHFLRHATFILEVAGLKLLVDPMLSAKDALDPVKGCRNIQRIPMVELPISEDTLTKLLTEIDGVIVTHTHRDHWDVKAQQLLKKDIALICQPSDTETLRLQGFHNLVPVNSAIDFKNLKIHRTGGQHGTGDIGIKMGHVSGFIVEYQNEKLYIAGDTIWCAEVEHALATHKPKYIVVNTGAAQFDQGDPITMTAEDVVRVAQASPSSRIIAVHMETVNHCWLTKDALKKSIDEKRSSSAIIIPADGQVLRLTA
jgi:L-ascorbate metabolism protein UlaG (beta-lactamase superfamily)